MVDGLTPEVHAALGAWAIEYKPLMTPAAFDELERRVMALVKAEREACAKIADREAADAGRSFGEWRDAALEIRDAIRARR